MDTRALAVVSVAVTTSVVVRQEPAADEVAVDDASVTVTCDCEVGVIDSISTDDDCDIVLPLVTVHGAPEVATGRVMPVIISSLGEVAGEGYEAGRGLRGGVVGGTR